MLEIHRGSHRNYQVKHKHSETNFNNLEIVIPLKRPVCTGDMLIVEELYSGIKLAHFSYVLKMSPICTS